MQGYEIDFSAVAAIVAAGVALLASWRANRIAAKNLSLEADRELLRLREKQLIELRNSFAEFASLACAMEMNSEGHIKRSDFAIIRKHSAKIKMLMNPLDEDYRLLEMILSDELGVATAEEKEQIGKEHLYTVAQRILSKGYQQLEIDISRYKNDEN